MSVLTWAVIIC